jgi:hypothetical protein
MIYPLIRLVALILSWLELALLPAGILGGLIIEGLYGNTASLATMKDKFGTISWWVAIGVSLLLVLFGILDIWFNRPRSWWIILMLILVILAWVGFWAFIFMLKFYGGIES